MKNRRIQRPYYRDEMARTVGLGLGSSFVVGAMMGAVIAMWWLS